MSVLIHFFSSPSYLWRWIPGMRQQHGNIKTILYDWLYDFIKIWKATSMWRDIVRLLCTVTNHIIILKLKLNEEFSQFSILMIHWYIFHISCPPDRRCSVHHSLLLEPLSIFCSPVEINKTQQNIPEYWTPRTLEPSSRLPRALVMIKQTLSYLTRKKVVIIRHMTHAFTKSKSLWFSLKTKQNQSKFKQREYQKFIFSVLYQCFRELWSSMVHEPRAAINHSSTME